MAFCGHSSGDASIVKYLYNPYICNVCTSSFPRSLRWEILMLRMLLTGSGLCLALLANVKVHSRKLLYRRGKIRGKSSVRRADMPSLIAWAVSLQVPLWGVLEGHLVQCRCSPQSLRKVGWASLFLGRARLCFISCLPSVPTPPGLSPL